MTSSQVIQTQPCVMSMEDTNHGAVLVGLGLPCTCQLLLEGKVVSILALCTRVTHMRCSRCGGDEFGVM